ncbi:uncharacterized protein LOC129939216 isoform X2 [Eupeodes corollae]|uniref:uncharacterized protein LOC129939216 isoform X2 n=1 Tax=Eupeodes corollae TaxID=290404 RepID=UPI002492383A|nr:uncharacterized protein LOC129939216 isoform X2 [Eupeodes corollae]
MEKLDNSLIFTFAGCRAIETFTEITHYNSEDQEDPVGVCDNFKKEQTNKTSCLTTQKHSNSISKGIATEKALNDLKMICKALSQPPEEQEFDCFGASVACQLRKLPEKMAQESMDYIQSFLVRQRLNSIENPCLEYSRNTKRMRSEASDNFNHVDKQDKNFNAEICQIAKRIKEKELEFLEIEHTKKLHILNLEKRKLENRLKNDEEEHVLKIQQLSSFEKQSTSLI